jgi:hypothetical protein
MISEHKVPPIGDIGFAAEGYNERFADINEKLTFDMLLDPTTQ